MPSSKPELPERPLALSENPPTRQQVYIVAWIALILVVALLATIPYAGILLNGTEPLLPAYTAAILVNDLITAALLLALFNIDRSRAILVLAMGYLFTGLLAIPWAATFPGVSPFEAGLQTTATIAVFRRVGFPLFILGYVVLRRVEARRQRPRKPNRPLALIAVLAVISSVALLTWAILNAQEYLPKFMEDKIRPTAWWQFVPSTAYLLYALILTALLTGKKSVLDLWLVLVIITLAIELLLLSYISAGARLSIGWWAGRLFGLASASVVLIAILSQLTTLYRRLVQSVAAERRIREDRLSATQALLAMIAHEVNQPLTSIVSSAGTGIRWLEREQPDLGEASAALRRVSRDGLRAGEVIRGIQEMFKKGSLERAPLDINREIRAILSRMQGEIETHGVTMELRLTKGLPMLMGNALQLQQVVANLVKNALDAISDTRGRDRILRVSTADIGEEGVMVSVEDSGAGIDPALTEQIFKPFFTTKEDGMGMGLLFSRSIIEAHGGRLWVSPGGTGGAKFCFSVPVNRQFQGGL